MRISHSLLEQQMLQTLRNFQTPVNSAQQTRPPRVQDSASFSRPLENSANVEAINDGGERDQKKRKRQNESPEETVKPESDTPPQRVKFTA